MMVSSPLMGRPRTHWKLRWTRFESEAREGRSDYECWPWQGARNLHGYGQFVWRGPQDDWPKKKQENASRVAWQIVNGEPDPEKHIDHICRNRACINPRHLRELSRRENYLAGVGPSAENARKTHCKRGHELSGENVFLKDGRRHCRRCRALQAAEWRRQNPGRHAEAQRRYLARKRTQPPPLP